jgi:hypothetical protein
MIETFKKLIIEIFKKNRKIREKCLLEKIKGKMMS